MELFEKTNKDKMRQDDIKITHFIDGKTQCWTLSEYAKELCLSYCYIVDLASKNKLQKVLQNKSIWITTPIDAFKLIPNKTK